MILQPALIGAGLSLFAGLRTRVRLDLVRTITFRSCPAIAPPPEPQQALKERTNREEALLVHGDHAGRLLRNTGWITGLGPAQLRRRLRQRFRQRDRHHRHHAVRPGDLRGDPRLLADSTGDEGRPRPRRDDEHTSAKLVFSNTLEKAEWNNTTLVTGDAADAIRELKRQPGGDLAIIGSPRLTASLLDQGLIDELRVGVHPVLLGEGRSLFSGLEKRIPLRLTRTWTLTSGNVRLFYKPVERSG